MIIHPTPGRVVHYHDTAIQHDHAQPLAAQIVYVQGDRLVNLIAYNQNGMKFERTSVTLVQDGDPTPNDRYATWPKVQTPQTFQP